MFRQTENNDFGMATLWNHYLHWLRFEVTIIRQIWMFHGGFAAAFHPWLNGSKDLMRYHRPKYVIMHKTSKGFLLRMGQVWAKSRQASTRANSRRVPKLKRTKDVLLIPKVCRQKVQHSEFESLKLVCEKKIVKSPTSPWSPPASGWSGWGTEICSSITACASAEAKDLQVFRALRPILASWFTMKKYEKCYMGEQTTSLETNECLPPCSESIWK